MKRWFGVIFSSKTKTASLPLIFLAIAFIAIAQWPIQFFIGREFLLAGIAVNELLFVAGLPLLLAFLLRMNGKMIFPFFLPSLRIILLCIPLTIAADVLIDYLTHASELLFSPPPEIKALFDQLMAVATPAEAVVKLVILCLLPAACEEIFFRGFCQRSFAVLTRPLFSILLTSILFAALHGNLWYFHLYLFLGLLFGWAFQVAGTLWVPIICHFTNNAWTFGGHILGMKLPAEKGMTPLDGLFIATAIAACVFFARMLKRECSREY